MQGLWTCGMGLEDSTVAVSNDTHSFGVVMWLRTDTTEYWSVGDSVENIHLGQQLYRCQSLRSNSGSRGTCTSSINAYIWRLSGADGRRISWTSRPRNVSSVHREGMHVRGGSSRGQLSSLFLPIEATASEICLALLSVRWMEQWR